MMRTLLTATALTGMLLSPTPSWGQPGRGVALVPPGIGLETPARMICVFISVENYTDKKFRPLGSCDEDAADLDETMRAVSVQKANLVVYRFSTDRKQAHQRPRRANLLGENSRLAKILAGATAKDTLFVAVMTHGHQGRDDSYLVLEDTVWNKLETTGLAIGSLRSMMQRSKAKNKLLSLDVCNAGAAKGLRQKSSEELARPFATTRDVLTFASCRVGQSSLEWPAKENGVYTYYFVNGLLGAADADGDRIVNTAELYAYLYSSVPKKVFALFEKEQIPIRVVPAGETPVFPISSYVPREYTETFGMVENREEETYPVAFVQNPDVGWSRNANSLPDGWTASPRGGLRMSRGKLMMFNTGTESVWVKPVPIPGNFFVEVEFQFKGIGGRKRRHLTIECYDPKKMKLASVTFKDEFHWILNTGGNNLPLKRNNQVRNRLRLERKGNKLRVLVNGIQEDLINVSKNPLNQVRLTVYNQQNWPGDFPEIYSFREGPLP